MCIVRKYVTMFQSPENTVVINLSNIRNTKSYLSNSSDHRDKLFLIISLETAILFCRTLASGAPLPVLEYILADAKKCTL